MCGSHASLRSSVSSHPTYGPAEADRPESDPAGGGFLEGVFRLLTLMKKDCSIL